MSIENAPQILAPAGHSNRHLTCPVMEHIHAESFVQVEMLPRQLYLRVRRKKDGPQLNCSPILKIQGITASPFPRGRYLRSSRKGLNLKGGLPAAL
jgi:hypothetical protein